MTRTIYITRAEVRDILTALLLADVNEKTLRIIAAAFGIDWFEVLVKAGRLVESQPQSVECLT